MEIYENLTWENHVDALSQKIASGIGAIKRINHCLPPAALHNVYYGLVQLHFDYYSVVWGSCGKTLRYKLQRLQNRAARVLTNSNIDADASMLLNELGWKNLETQRLINKAVMVYKSLKCHAPDYLSSKFIQRSDKCNSFNLRDSENKLAVPLPHTSYYRNSFCYSGAVLWKNWLSDIHVRQAKSLTSFRQLLTSNSNTTFMEKQALILIFYFILFLFFNITLLLSAIVVFNRM